MSRHTNTTRMIVTVLLPLFALVGVIALALWPQLKNARTALSEIKGEFLEDNEQFAAETLRKFLARVDASAIAELYVPSGRPLDFIKEIETLGHNASSTIAITVLQSQAASKDAPKTKKDAPPTPVAQGFEVRLEGDFDGAITFLKGLEAIPKLYSVEDLLIQTVAEKGSKTPLLRTIIQLHAPIFE